MFANIWDKGTSPILYSKVRTTKDVKWIEIVNILEIPSK